MPRSWRTRGSYSRLVVAEAEKMATKLHTRHHVCNEARSLGHLMHVLQTSPIDYVRNECLSLLLLLTAANADIQRPDRQYVNRQLRLTRMFIACKHGDRA